MSNDSVDERSIPETTSDPGRSSGKKMNPYVLVAGIAVVIVVLAAALFAFGVFDDKGKEGEQCGDNVYYTFDESAKTLDIFVNGQGKGVMYDFEEGETDPPWMPYSKSIKHIVIDKGVTVIGEEAFYYLPSVVSVDLPDGLRDIHVNAFTGCKSLKTVKIPGSVESISEEAFDDCGALDTISVDPDNGHYTSSDGILYSKDMSTIVKYPAGKPSSSFTVPENIVTIGKSAFDRCHNLVSVEIPDGVKTIGTYAFYECDRLQSISVSISGSIEKIGEWAFTSCKDLSDVKLNNGLKTIGEKAFYECESLTTIEIPNTVTRIEFGSFDSCTSLVSIVVPDSVEYLGDFAFFKCKSLTSAYIGKGVENDQNGVFHLCESLEAIDVDPENMHFSSRDGVLYSKDESVLIRYPEGKAADLFIIPETVTTIAANSFLKCNSLTSVTITKNVVTIDKRALNLFESVESFSVVTDNPNYSSEDGILYDKGKNTLVRYPPSYPSTTFTVPANVSIIGDSAVSDCKNLVSVTVPGTVKKICDSAFSNCDSLISVDLGEGIESMGYLVFIGCDSLVTATIPDSVTTMDNGAFEDCKSLVSAVIGKGLTEITSTFFGCTSLVTATLPETLTEIGDLVFSDCTSLALISLPTGLETIGEDAFEEFTFFDFTDGTWKEIEIVADNLKGKTWAGQGGLKLYHAFLVEFDLNYGSEGTYTDSWTAVEGKLPELPADPVREGYLFDGWFTEPDGGKKVTVDTQFTSDTELYAHWKQA